MLEFGYLIDDFQFSDAWTKNWENHFIEMQINGVESSKLLDQKIKQWLCIKFKITLDYFKAWFYLLGLQFSLI